MVPAQWCIEPSLFFTPGTPLSLTAAADVIHALTAAGGGNMTRPWALTFLTSLGGGPFAVPSLPSLFSFVGVDRLSFPIGLRSRN